MCILLYWKCCLLLSNGSSSCRSCCCCWNYIYIQVVQRLLLLLFFVIVCRMPQFVAVGFAADSSVSSSLFRHDLYRCTPWQCCRIYVQSRIACNPILKNYLTHPRKMTACVEPRRAAGRRGEDALDIYRHVYISHCILPEEKHCENILYCGPNFSFYLGLRMGKTASRSLKGLGYCTYNNLQHQKSKIVSSNEHRSLL